MKLSKQQTKAHDAACVLLAKTGALSPKEIDQVYEDWNPGACHNLTWGQAFFTPYEIAREIPIALGIEKGTVVDLCAGIGRLSRCLLDWQPDLKVTCIEINPDFVSLGKRLVPEAEWIRMDVLDCPDIFNDLFSPRDPFDYCISNPPFGGSENSLKLSLAIVEVATKITKEGGLFILPQSDCPFRFSGRRGFELQESSSYDRFRRAVQNKWKLEATSWDLSVLDARWNGLTSPPVVELANLEREEL